MKKTNISEIFDEVDYDEYFSYIVDYTDGGFPYGVTWEQEGISRDLPMDERLKLLDEKYNTNK